jgi:lauroyl/myristoyl acyltransferase
MIPSVSRMICFFGRRFVKRDISILRDNLDQVRGLTKGSEDALDFEKRTFYNHICSALETLKFSCNHDLLRVDGAKKLHRFIEASREQGKGCMIVTAHMGSWEAMGWYLAKFSDFNFYALARRPRCKALECFLERFRERIGTKVLLIDRPLLLRDMVRTLNGGGILGVVMDQRPAGGRRTSVDFLGRKTDFVCGPAIAARKANCAVYSVFCVKKGPMHYELISNEVVPAPGCDDEVNALTQGMATAIERTVDLYPDQWTWHYDRWKISKAYA